LLKGGDAKDSKKHVLIMDEVDGIAGNEDRGGIQELIYLIQATKIPIICICNDRQHTKIRSLANHCLDLRFHQPKVGQIKGPMMSIAFKEGIKIDPTILQNIITSCSCDIRQVLNNLSVWAGDKALCDNRFKDPTVKRPILMTPFDVVKKVFNPVENGTELTLREKSDLFFQDYSIGPLFVQENYLNIKPLNKPNTLELLKLMSDTADAICQGDLISKVIRTDNSWELLPCQAIFSSVLPGELMRGYLGKPPEFPRWLGNFSKTKKYDRILQELQQHTRLSCLCNKHEFGMDYAQILRFKITEPLIKKGDEKSNIAEVCDILNHYDLTRTDWENLVDVTQFTSRPQLLSLIDTKVKTAFTRYFNKNAAQLPYNTLISAVRKKRRPSNDDDDEEDDEQEDEEELIKIIKKNGKKDETSSKNKRRKITP
jgi:replication factor C subunit 1